MAKTKAPKEHTEEEWKLVSKERRAQEEAECLACEEATRKAQEEAERKVEEECRVQEEAARAREEAKEATEREEAAKRAVEAAEERADAERRAVGEHLWEVAGQHLEMAVAPPQVAKPSRRMTVAGPRLLGSKIPVVSAATFVLGAAKGKTMACEVCCHAKVSCSWSKKMVGEPRKQKHVWRSEEAEDTEAIDMGEDEDEEQPHFAVPQHLAEEH
ncbi:hypothetical protein ID866_12798 [Astraeus odoratus]|nr:hypothetical protein ID866_12798 [Astraeus odoratus]